MPTIDPGFNDCLWWFVLGAFAGWLLFVIVDKLLWRDGQAAAEQEQATIAQLQAELDVARAEESSLRRDLDARQDETRRATLLSEELRDRAATSDQQVLNLEAALAAARHGSAAVALGATGVALAPSADAEAPPVADGNDASHEATDASRARADHAPESTEPSVDHEPTASALDAGLAQESLFEPVTTIIRTRDGDTVEATVRPSDDPPAATVAMPAPLPDTSDSIVPSAPPVDTPSQVPESDPVRALRAALDETDDALDTLTLPTPDEEELFGAPTEILTEFHLHTEDDGLDPDTDMMLDADTLTLADSVQRRDPKDGGSAHGGSSAGRPTRLTGDRSAETFGKTRSMLDRLQDENSPATQARQPRADREDDMSLVNRLRGAFGRRKPGSDR